MAKESLSDLEEQVIEFWQKNRIFERSVSERPKDRHFVFYDGPPFATGLPHYGHLLGSTLKDVLPRYWTMKGYRVERVWGWDCHGLPVENMIEKELKIQNGKKGIEEFGVEKFCQACRASVLRLDKEWQKFITRIGRFVDMDKSYKTMDNNYIESVWWGFKKLWEKGLVYEGRRVILYCSRCATPLSDFEIAMDKSYQEVEDDSVYVKFEVKTPGVKEFSMPEYFLAWTTTPWTLPGNVALAVDEKADYVKIRTLPGSHNSEVLILAKSRLGILKESYELLEEVKGRDLIGLAYEPLYKFLPIGDKKKAFYVVGADFVDVDEGSGLVHTAVMYGEKDYQLGLKENLPQVPMLDDEGRFFPWAGSLAGRFFKEANPLVIDDLRERNLIYRREKIKHAYPFCYRCETPLFYNAVPAWFINIQKIKKELVEANEKINWYPEHFKHGQFKDILESSPDWNISRSRYWGNPMPIWICEICQARKIVGSVEELEKEASKIRNSKFDLPAQAGIRNMDLHRPYIDEIKLKCECGGEMVRIPEVFDCWLESASMPFAAKHYPFENKEWFEQNYPADFIGEYSGQVRAWFNVLHRISVALFGLNSFKNVVVTGVYLGTDGKKMSKSRGNYPDPMILADEYGLDALRFYMMGSNVMKAEDAIFSEGGVAEARNQFVNLFYNSFRFLRLYSSQKFTDEWPEIRGFVGSTSAVLNRWIAVRTEQLVKDVTKFLDNYDTVTTCKLLREYVSDLSTWYLRRSREAIRHGDPTSIQILATSLITFAKLTAPITPFMSEIVYRDLTGNESVHLADWPEGPRSEIRDQRSEGLMEEMEMVRKICELGHAARKKKNIKVRQPLAALEIKMQSAKIKDKVGLVQLIKDELNVKLVDWQVREALEDPEISLDTTITPELKIEGEAREFVRRIQDLRKELGLQVADRIRILAPTWPKAFEDYIKKETLALEIVAGEELKVERVS